MSVTYDRERLVGLWSNHQVVAAFLDQGENLLPRFGLSREGCQWFLELTLETQREDEWLTCEGLSKEKRTEASSIPALRGESAGLREPPQLDRKGKRVLKVGPGRENPPVIRSDVDRRRRE